MSEQSRQPGDDPDIRNDLDKMDAQFIRVLEDLIDVLVAKGVINLTDLPPEALAKLNQRRRARRRLRGALDLIEDDDGIL